MLQVFQNLKTGDTELVDVPAPGAEVGHLLIRTRRSLISLGTEHMLVEFGRANLLGKASQQPEKVRQVGDRVVSNGHHAEVVLVPVNLCAKVPEGVSDDEAAFTVLGAIALQGIRLTQPTLGEAFA